MGPKYLCVKKRGPNPAFKEGWTLSSIKKDCDVVWTWFYVRCTLPWPRRTKKLGNVRWISGVTFVVTSVHFWKNDPISVSMQYHCLKLSSTCRPDPEDVSRYFVCCQKMFCATLRTIKVEHVDKKIIQQRKWSWIQSCSKSCWFWWSHF